MVTAPLVTELREGFVVLGFTVKPDGSVHDVRVLESGGDEQWIEAAIAALSQWRYRESDRSLEKTQKLTFEFES
jgi:TonB family protein